jgi:hypothetical protein
MEMNASARELAAVLRPDVAAGLTMVLFRKA